MEEAEAEARQGAGGQHSGAAMCRNEGQGEGEGEGQGEKGGGERDGREFCSGCLSLITGSIVDAHTSAGHRRLLHAQVGDVERKVYGLSCARVVAEIRHTSEGTRARTRHTLGSHEVHTRNGKVHSSNMLLDIWIGTTCGWH